MRLRLALASLLTLVGSAAAFSAPASPAQSRPVLPFIEDDYARALAEAKARNVPLFVDAWAPWCHSCQSMRAYVLTDRALAKLAPSFVWLAIDTEKDQNAAFVARFPIEAWPTLLFIDPRSEAVLLRRLGSATVAQLQEMANEARQAFTSRAAGWQAALEKADRLYGEAKNAEAATAYAAVLRDAPTIWGGRGRVLESYLLALSVSDQARRCAEIARVEYPEVYQTPAALTVASVGLDCAVSLPAADEARAELVKHMEAFAREAVEKPSPDAAADDVSDVYLSLHAAREAEKDDAGARAIAEEWGGFLAREANAAMSARARAVFDSHRLTVDLALGQTDQAIAMLQASEHNLPDDYNPPARLALAYAAAKRYDEALAASDRALAKVYGPRRITVLRQRAEILVDKGDRAAARTALDQALALARALPDAQHASRMIQAIQKKQAELGQSAE
jgi:tetratricopeptide (TPR) repeat protein